VSSTGGARRLLTRRDDRQLERLIRRHECLPLVQVLEERRRAMERKRGSVLAIGIVAPALALAAAWLPGCYVYQQREPAIVAGLDADQSLDVAAQELAQNKVGTVLGIWALRDQPLTGAQAARVAALYFANIDRIDSDAQAARSFSVWHLTWAIADMYRLGGGDVRTALAPAYADASARVNRLDVDIAKRLFYGEKVMLGDIHLGGRAYARSHLVAPGNPRYLQSEQEYEVD
jgi:hypothetical protein